MQHEYEERVLESFRCRSNLHSYHSKDGFSLVEVGTTSEVIFTQDWQAFKDIYSRFNDFRGVLLSTWARNREMNAL